MIAACECATSRGTTQNMDQGQTTGCHLGDPHISKVRNPSHDTKETFKLTSHALDARCLVGRKLARPCRNAAVVVRGVSVGLYLLKLKCPVVLDGGPCPGCCCCCCCDCWCCCWPGGGDCDMPLWSPEADIATSIAGLFCDVCRCAGAGRTECGKIVADCQAHTRTLR